MTRNSTPTPDTNAQSSEPMQTTSTTQSPSPATSSSESESSPSPLAEDLLRTAEFMELVRADPDLNPEEREVTLSASDATDTFSFFSDSPSFTRRSLRNTMVTVTELHIKTEDGARTTIEYTDDLSPDDIPTFIYGCEGTINIRALEVTSISREHDRLSGVIPQ